MAWKFEVRAPRGMADVADVRYDCACGCHPNARYRRRSDEAAHEHCCCGNVHFAGPQAESQLRVYLEERRAEGLDADRGPYIVGRTQVKAPWGELIEVAFAEPQASHS